MRSKYYDIHKKAVKQRSITPETYKEDKVQFIKNKVLSQNKKDFIEDELFYVDQYQYKDSNISHVLHFGINLYFDNLKQEIDIYNGDYKLKPPSSKGSSKARQEEYSKFTKQIVLTNIEQLITKEAISYLLGNQNIRTVLLDVFERNSEGIVDIKEGNTIDTHTVVLYKDTNKNSIFVVDPSNPQFSNYLANIKDCQLEIKAGYIDKKIYKAPNKDLVGSHTDQWRDCVDIAVKLAFGFNKIAPDFNFENDEMFLKSIQNDIVIKNITNQQIINNNLLEEVESNPMRIRQASNYETSEKANKKLGSVDMLFREMKKFEKVIEPIKEIRIKCIEKVAERLSVDYKPSNYDLALQDYNHTISNVHKLFVESLNQGVSNYTTDLSGNIYDALQD